MDTIINKQNLSSKEHLNILLVIDQYEEANNGTTITARRLADGLKLLGHSVGIVCARGGGGVIKKR